MIQPDRYFYPIQIELVKLLYQQIKFALWPESLAALGLAIVLWGHIDTRLLCIWLIFNLSICGLARHILVYFYHKKTKHINLTESSAHYWLMLFSIGALLSGISWGMAGSILMVEHDLMRQCFIIFILMGVTAAANPLYSADIRVFTAFLLTAFVPFTIWLLLQGGIYNVLGMLSCVYIFLMFSISYRVNELIIMSLRLRFENIELVGDLYQKANFDFLTGLPNRALVLDRVTQVIAHAKRTESNIGVLFLDLDRFKLINDTLGHAFGDKLLREVAQRFTNCVREYDTVSRAGGDEFLMILPLLKNEKDASVIARKCIAIMKEPFVINGHTCTLSTSIGISIYPKDGINMETLIRNADIAMYRAKELGKNNFQFYTEAMNKKILTHTHIENELHEAIKTWNQFSLVYQPIVNLKSKNITGMEALLRWHHPTIGDIAPMEFIPVAEDADLMHLIGAWVLKTACMQMKKWHEEGFSSLKIYVNISVSQFKFANFFENTMKILMEAGLMPTELALELPEILITGDFKKNIDKIEKFKKAGVEIVVKGFSIDHSTLYHLKKLAIDKIKINRSFVKEIVICHEDTSIIEAIIALAIKLNLKTIVEGVENENQLSFLINHHCDEIQGYYFSGPLDASSITELLYENKKLTLPYNSQ